MSCRDCEDLLAQGERPAGVEQHLEECTECRALGAELRENAVALAALREEEMPRLAVRIPGRRLVYGWLAAAAAAAFMIGMLLPKPPAPAPQAPAKTAPKMEPLKIKMLTPDPDVVIYWLIDN